MAITTSPYQANDYQAASAYRPYRLPVNDIFKGLAAQNQFWDEGARRVKQYYDSALDLNLTLDENKEIRKNFMAQAEQQIAKLSTMNLADPSVQREGLSIFKPLFQDKGILLDDQITRKYGSILGDAERFKRDEKTKGEGYSSTNLRYALMGFEGFNGKTSRGQLEEIYDKVKGAEYTPYYDYSKDYFEALNKCKPDKASSNSLQGLYTYNLSTETLSPDKVGACIGAGMNEKARNQLRIEGAVTYKGNEAALAAEYTPYLASIIDGRKKNIHDYEAELQGKIDAKTITPEEKDFYGKLIASEKSTLQHDQMEYDGLMQGDLTSVIKNFEPIASAIYTKNSMSKFGNAFSYTDTSKEFKPDAAAITQYTQGRIDARQDDNQRFEMEKLEKEKDYAMKLKQMDLMGDMMKGDGSGGKSGMSATQRFQLFRQLGMDPSSDVFSVQGTATESDDHYNLVNSMIAEGRQRKSDALDNMLQIAKEAGIFSGTIANENYAPVIRAVNTYMAQFKGQPDKAKANPYFQQMTEYYNDWLEGAAQQRNASTILKQAEADVIKQNPDLFQKNTAALNSIDDLGELKDAAGRVIDKGLMKDIISGRNTDWSVEASSFDKTVVFRNKHTKQVIVPEQRSTLFSGSPSGKLYNIYQQLHDNSSTYDEKVKQAVGGKLASAGLIYSAPKGAEVDLLQQLRLMNPEFANPDAYRIEAGKYDPTTGAVQPLIYKKNGKTDEKGALVPFEGVAEGSNVGAGIVKDIRGEKYIVIPGLQLTQEDNVKRAYKATAARLTHDNDPVTSSEIFSTRTGNKWVMTVEKPKGKAPVYKLGMIPAGETAPIYYQDMRTSDMNEIANMARQQQRILNNQ